MVSVLGFAACALVPGGRMGAVQALAVACALVAYIAALTMHEAGTGRPAVPREAAKAVVVAGALAAVLAVPAIAVVWLLPVGLLALVLVFAVAAPGTGGRGHPPRQKRVKGEKRP
ncbi:hypothetical protein ACFXPV_33750 [Streptomyces sp. NPDC059118]|uniref:hypothetical protein n=1 Tax=unclassified Streptomyces TaxID=2593676 RepID=UPI0036C59360